MSRRKQPKPVHQLSASEFEAMFPNEDACKAYLQARRWPQGVCCPRCGNPAVYDLPSRKWHWQCAQCAPDGYRFSHHCRDDFREHKQTASRLVSRHSLDARQQEGNERTANLALYGLRFVETAWSMCHKVRVALMEDIGSSAELSKLMKLSSAAWLKTGIGISAAAAGTGGIGSGKTPIVGAVSRKGNVVARVVANVNSATLTAFVREAVSHKVSLLCTDQYPGYNPLDKDYPHATIDHARGQYVIGAIHTQTIEGFWSIFKRGVVGTFHKMSRKYMPLYVAEFQFRYNNRENADIFGTAIRGC